MPLHAVFASILEFPLPKDRRFVSHTDARNHTITNTYSKSTRKGMALIAISMSWAITVR